MHIRTNSTRKRMQINARKLIVAMGMWVISVCKRDCDLHVRSKTFRMYYTCLCPATRQHAHAQL